MSGNDKISLSCTQLGLGGSLLGLASATDGGVFGCGWYVAAALWMLTAVVGLLEAAGR